MTILIRPATLADATHAIPCIYSSGPKSFDFVFQQSMPFLMQSFQNGRSQFGFQNHYVACIENSQQPLQHKVIASIACFDRHQAQAMEWGCILDMLDFYRWQFIRAAFRGLRFERLVPKPIKHSLYIAHLGIDEGFRSQGIGRQLIDWAIAKAKRQGYQSVSLDVAKSNPRAEQLYKAMGFVEIRYKKSTISGISDHATLVLNLR